MYLGLFILQSSKKRQHNAVKVITRFSAQHIQLLSILSTHGHLFTDHHILTKYVESTPEMVFLQLISLRDRITSSHYRAYVMVSIAPPRYISLCQMSSVSLDSWGYPLFYFLHMFDSCRTREVSYLMTCICKVFYVGKTIYCSWNGKLTMVG